MRYPELNFGSSEKKCCLGRLLKTLLFRSNYFEMLFFHNLFMHLNVIALTVILWDTWYTNLSLKYHWSLVHYGLYLVSLAYLLVILISGTNGSNVKIGVMSTFGKALC